MNFLLKHWGNAKKIVLLRRNWRTLYLPEKVLLPVTLLFVTICFVQSDLSLNVNIYSSIITRVSIL